MLYPLSYGGKVTPELEVSRCLRPILSPTSRKVPKFGDGSTAREDAA